MVLLLKLSLFYTPGSKDPRGNYYHYYTCFCRSGEAYGQPPQLYQSPLSPVHSRSASNPVMLRSHGATSAAVDSLFAYHQKTNPEPSAPARPSPGSETSHYLPPQAAVQQVCRPGAPAQPRLQSWGSNFLVWGITAFLWKKN